MTMDRITDIMMVKGGFAMTINAMMASRNMSMYRLAQLSGLPKTTVIDICSGKSAISGCTAKTVWKLSQALGCTMEELMEESAYDAKSGRPLCADYLEKGLPAFLKASIKAMQASWAVEDSGKRDLHWDAVWCSLNADINEADTEQLITPEQAAHLRTKYLRMEERND